MAWIRIQFVYSYTTRHNGVTERESTSWWNHMMNANNVQSGRMHSDGSPCHQQIAWSKAWFSLAIPGIIQERADCFTFQIIWVRYIFVPNQYVKDKVGKKAIRCAHKVYVLPHVVFDDESSWWSTGNIYNIANMYWLKYGTYIKSIQIRIYSK